MVSRHSFQKYLVPTRGTRNLWKQRLQQSTTFTNPCQRRGHIPKEDEPRDKQTTVNGFQIEISPIKKIKQDEKIECTGRQREGMLFGKI